MNKRFFIYLILFLMPACLLAQETVVRKKKLTPTVTERISVLKANDTVRQGLYQAILKETDNALASGVYTSNTKTGVWSFYDKNNTLIQRYNYTTKTLIYEAAEDTTSSFRYVVDDTLKEGDRVSKPIKIGDRYFGYINYLKTFKMPDSYIGINTAALGVVLELLISPGGRLADYTVHMQSFSGEQKFAFNLDLLTEEDKTFIPARLNGTPIPCRIFIQCRLGSDGKIDID